MEVKLTETFLESMQDIQPGRDGVYFTKNGLRLNEWDDDSHGFIEKPIEETDSFRLLRETCKIDSDVTLGDIFEAVAGNELLKQFIRMYSRCFAIDEFHEEAKLSNPKPEDKQVEYLEIAKYIEIDEDNLGNALVFHGIGEPWKDGPGNSYSISLSPMSELAHLEVRINTKASIQKDFKEIGASIWSPSLLEVLDAIYWDISFYGGPAGRKKVCEKLDVARARLDAGIEKTYSMEEVFGKKDTPVN